MKFDPSEELKKALDSIEPFDERQQLGIERMKSLLAETEGMMREAMDSMVNEFNALKSANPAIKAKAEARARVESEIFWLEDLKAEIEAQSVLLEQLRASIITDNA